jgi:transposase
LQKIISETLTKDWYDRLDPVTLANRSPLPPPKPNTCTLEELEVAMDCGCDNKVFRRLNAILLLLGGAAYEIVLRNSRVCDRMLRLWISRFNARGIYGLTYRLRSGRPRMMDAAKVESDILPLVDDPSQAGETHWTVVKLCGWLRENIEIDLSYRTLVRYLHEHEYVRKNPRPMLEPLDREAWEDRRAAFGDELLELLGDLTCEVFLGDESGFEGDPRPRSKWFKRGSRPTQVYQG